LLEGRRADENEGMTRPTPNDAEVFMAGMQRVAAAPANELERVLAWARVCELERDEFLLRGGEVAVLSGLVVSGLVREYFVLPDGTERTKAFVQPGEVTGSLADLLSARPSRAFVVAQERSRLLVFDFDALRKQGERSAAWLGWYARSLERMFCGKADREYELLGMDADERYAAFAGRYPGLEARVAARHVASYLGITPVHLSRLRRLRRTRARGLSRAHEGSAHRSH
jgi:CRP-like cAMP-binding protein